jgi:hypothetical protein
MDSTLVAGVGKNLGDIVRRKLIFSCLFQHANGGQVSKNPG